jgi:hypothetical protein
MYDLQDKSHKKEKVERLCRYVLGSWFDYALLRPSGEDCV